jgi:hypothetical protein
MAQLVLLMLCGLPLATHQSSFRSYRKMESASEESARSIFADAGNLLHGLEIDLAKVAQQLHLSSAASLVQLDSTLDSTPVKAAASAKKESATPVKTAASAKTESHKKRGIDATTAVKEMAGMKPDQMPAMLGLLTGMYDSWKDKISEANKKEKEQKESYEKTVADLEAKKAQFKGDAEAIATYDRIENYWKRQRSISHRQYHTALKIMHSGMSKFKSVSEAMSNAIAGKKPSSKDLQTMGMAMPDVVFLQRKVQHFAVWAQVAKQYLKKAKVLSAA